VHIIIHTPSRAYITTAANYCKRIVRNIFTTLTLLMTLSCVLSVTGASCESLDANSFVYTLTMSSHSNVIPWHCPPAAVSSQRGCPCDHDTPRRFSFLRVVLKTQRSTHMNGWSLSGAREGKAPPPRLFY